MEEEELVTQQLIEDELTEPVHRQAEGGDDLNMPALCTHSIRGRWVRLWVRGRRWRDELELCWSKIQAARVKWPEKFTLELKVSQTLSWRIRVWSWLSSWKLSICSQIWKHCCQLEEKKYLQSLIALPHVTQVFNCTFWNGYTYNINIVSLWILSAIRYCYPVSVHFCHMQIHTEWLHKHPTWCEIEALSMDLFVLQILPPDLPVCNYLDPKSIFLSKALAWGLLQS